MKLIKKFKLIISLTLLTTCLCGTFVTVCADTVKEDATEKATEMFIGGTMDLEQTKEFLNLFVTNNIVAIDNYTDREIEYIANNAKIDLYRNWLDTTEGVELGKFKSCEFVEIAQNEESEYAVDTTAVLHYEKEDITMELTLEIFPHLQNDFMVSAQFALGDTTKSESNNTMLTATVNTVVGMGTVFVVLIFMSLLIGSFVYISKIQEAFAKKGKEEPKVDSNQIKPVESVEVMPVSNNLVADTELIAVIAAAIAASEGTTTDGFIVRSIRKRY